MTQAVPTPTLPTLSRILAWKRARVALGVGAFVGLLISPGFDTVPTAELVFRMMVVALGALIAFGVLERWPKRLPRWLARWALQVIGVAIAMPIMVGMVYSVIMQNDPVPFHENTKRQQGFAIMTFMGLLIGPWIAVAALFRQSEIAARTQALNFELERSALENKALDSRLRLLQAQVEPHFLFNTLANVRELVDSGSPDASKVLAHLITYLRTAVPRLHDPSSSIEQEVQLVRSYLELMHLRMPDRLQFGMQVDEDALALRCPPTTLLTLVENAIRHGIDPSEDGGRIDVCVCVRDGRCFAEVKDTGVGLAASNRGLGTGLASLRERLQLAFGKNAHVRLASLVPHGVSATAEFPAQVR